MRCLHILLVFVESLTAASSLKMVMVANTTKKVMNQIMKVPSWISYAKLMNILASKFPI